MAIFSRPYRRTIITRPGCCVCPGGARVAYRITKIGETKSIERCPACANHYPADKYTSEPLPHITAQFEAMVYDGYKLHRATYTPEQLAELFLTFKGRIEQLEARYQAEIAGKREAS